MYVGLNSCSGILVRDEDAFGYAMDRIKNDKDTYEEFILNFRNRLTEYDFSDFRRFKELAADIVDWFFSGSWIHDEQL